MDRLGLLFACSFIFWMFCRPWSTPSAGFTTKLPFRWHPASWLSESYIIGRKTWKSLLSKVGLVLLLIGTVILPYPACFLAWLLSLAYLLPLWHVFLDTLRRDKAIKSRRIILYQPKSPLNSKVEKKTDSNGRIVEITPEIYWFMDKNDMDHLAGASAHDKKSLNNCRIAAGFYKGKVTNEFLQLFDSLSLYKFLVDHANVKTMLAVEALAKYFGGNKDCNVLSEDAEAAATPAANVRPPTPAARTNAPRPPDPEARPASRHAVEEEPSAEDLRRSEPIEEADLFARSNDEPPAAEPADEGQGRDEKIDQDPDVVDQPAEAEGEEPDSLEVDEDEPVHVAAVPLAGQTTKEQDEELQTVRDKALDLPTDTATGPQLKTKRDSAKPLGGRKTVIKFKKSAKD